jgi:predicted GH43/DUF377 family glycosyl hydrolase
MKMPEHRFKELFTRHPGNPIIQSKDIPYRASSVFNAGAAGVGDETLLLLRIEDRRGISHLTAARSKDGVSDWVIDSEPTLWPSPRSHPEEIWGIEDPRITYLEEEGVWVILYTAYSNSGPLVSLATTRDFRTFERKGAVMPPEDKDAALFPVRFGGRWAMLHRPVPAFPGVGAHIWISFSPDMYHWGEHRVLIHARKGGMWDAGKIGLSPPPIRTEKGWLVLYHGVKMTASGCIYRLGLAMLDLENPAKLTYRADEWVFAPEESYELAGDVDKVVFPCGWLVQGDEVRLYYGGADKCIALATGSLREIVGWLTK